MASGEQNGQRNLLSTRSEGKDIPVIGQLNCTDRSRNNWGGNSRGTSVRLLEAREGLSEAEKDPQ